MRVKKFLKFAEDKIAQNEYIRQQAWSNLDTLNARIINAPKRIKFFGK